MPKFNLFVEIKGGFGGKDKKLELLYKQYPDFPIRVIDGEVYKVLKNKFSNAIKEWEK